MGIVLNILLLIFVLGILIFVHELGHYLFAKKHKVHIYEFALGMGPKLLSRVGRDGVLYSLRAFPIGGFCALAGQEGEDDENLKKDDFMCNKTAWQKIQILLAGVGCNILLALILLFGSALIWGATNLRPVISEVIEGFPMAEAGIGPGDTITSINGRRVRTWDKAQLILHLNHEGPYIFVIRHADGAKEKYEITPIIETNEEGVERQIFGFGVDTTKERGLIPSLTYSFVKLGAIISSMGLVIISLFTGNLSLNALAGPVGIYGVVGDSASLGLEYLIYIIAFLSINLAFINALPFPAFDGGRILFIIIEKIKGSPVNPKIENMLHTIGFILLIALMLYVTFNDILRLF